MTTRRLSVASLGELAAMPALAQPAGWGCRQIRIIVPFAAGGAIDAFARLVADRLRRMQGWPMVVENRPGARATIGATA
jgi:tripartite-type tricarboxylate transporter receptor subunit TctC